MKRESRYSPHPPRTWTIAEARDASGCPGLSPALAEWLADHLSRARGWTLTRLVRSIEVDGQTVRVGKTSYAGTAGIAAALQAATGGLLVIAAGLDLDADAERGGAAKEWREVVDAARAFAVDPLIRQALAGWTESLAAEGRRPLEAVRGDADPSLPSFLARVLLDGGPDGVSPLRISRAGVIRPEPVVFRVIPLALAQPEAPSGPATPAVAAPARPVRYDLGPKLLERWARQALRVETGADGTRLATFRFEGVTCGARAIPLAFEYTVRLGDASRGDPVEELSCAPAPGSRGHERMCAWQMGAAALREAWQVVPPVVGQPLDQALAWRPAQQTTGCLCTEAARDHKWRLVLQVLHHQLRQSATHAARV